MIIRRASRFGNEAGFTAPFMREIAKVVIQEYGDAYPELLRNQAAILSTITDEERRFRRTVEAGLTQLEQTLSRLEAQDEEMLPGHRAFDLYATYGLPLEITRDIVRERDMDVDEAGFHTALETHREVSGAGDEDEHARGVDVQRYREMRTELDQQGRLRDAQVEHDPYTSLERETQVLALIRGEETVNAASPGDELEVILRETPFYVEAGGQVSDVGTIVSISEPRWEIDISDVRQPVNGLIVHVGEVKRGEPRVDEVALAAVHRDRRWDIMRNHTATHLLHAALRDVLGGHARQAGSLVAPDRLRFDFTHPEALTKEELEGIEQRVNDAILANYPLDVEYKPQEEAIEQGALALFGETYGETVRTIRIGEEEPLSMELCGGTHVPETGVIGPFKILSEGSVAAGIRRIEAVTGRAALEMIQERLSTMERISHQLGASPGDLEAHFERMQEERQEMQSELDRLRSQLAQTHYERLQPEMVQGIPVLTGIIPEIGMDQLRQLADQFKSQQARGVVVLASNPNGRPGLVAAVTDDLVSRGLHAGRLAQHVAEAIGGGGGGKATLAQAGGKDASGLQEALSKVIPWVKSNLTPEA
jgi:alanyl-tRNA synthetase